MRFWFFAFILFAACKHAPTSNNEVKDSSTTNRVTLVVIAGGFNSCPDDSLVDRFMAAGKTSEMNDLFVSRGLSGTIQSKTGQEPVIFSTCYSGPDSLLHSGVQNIYGRFSWGAQQLDGDRVGVTTFFIKQGAQLNNVSYLDRMKVVLQQYIDRQQSRGTAVDLFLIGHSYGGFTVIQLADEFSEQLKGLATIDPISMLKCQARTMMTEIYSTVTRRHQGCLVAPNDNFSKASIAKLKSVVGDSNGAKWWHHSYQNAFPFLQSGAIIGFPGQVPENRMFRRAEFRNALRNGDYHSQLGRNTIIWDVIHARLRDSL